MLKCTLNSDELAKAKAIVDGSQKIVISTHISPDGDAIGSSCAMAQLLVKMGKEVTIVLPDHAPAYLSWLSGNEYVVVCKEQGEETAKHIEEADAIFILDYNHLGRIGETVKKLLEAQMGVKPFILIDHHEQPATFPEVVYSDTSICSTCEMVFHFAGAMNWLELIDVPTAQAIYCGIMTDTMSFRFPSVSPETHEISAWLMRKGLKPHVVHENVLDSQRLDRLRLMGYALSECMTILPEYKAAYIAITKENIDRFQPQSGDTEGLVNMALSVEGTTIAAFFREDEDCVRISFRSKGARDVNQMARAHFNGGGHKNAAGARIHESLEHTIAKFLELLQKGEI